MKRSNGTTPTSGYVYAIDCGDKIKIGCSAQPEERIRTLAKTLGLADPRSHISKKCFEHYCFERKVHDSIGGKSQSGEFFNISFSNAVNIIDEIVIEVTARELDFISESKSNRDSTIKDMSNDLLGINANRDLETANRAAYDAVLLDAISWNDSFGLDYIDDLSSCNGCLVSLMGVSLQIHKAIISEYAKTFKEIK